MAKPMHVLAKAYTELYGFHLVPIDPGRKFPSANDWGNQAISDPDKAESFYKDNPDWNMGVALGPSNLCSLDIDCDESFAMIMEEFGIDPDELLGYPTIQGRDKGRRLMFRVPDNVSLPYTKMNWPSSKDPSGDIHKQMMKDAARAKEEGDTEKESNLREDAKHFARYTVFELRSSCDGKQRQDVVPPSMHPDTGKPYKWLVKPPAKGKPWPEPPKWLLAMWSAWDDFKPQLQAACPWTEKPEPPKPKQQPKRPESDQGGNVIQAFIDAHDLRMILEQYGYSRKGKSRYLSPHTSTNLPGVVLFPDEQSCWIHHASDPLCSEEHGRPVNAFDLFCEYEHGGDIGKAVKSAGEMLGIKPVRKHPEGPRPEPKPDESEPQPTDAPADSTPGEFRFLGVDDGTYFYLPRSTQQVTPISAAGHSNKSNLLQLASLPWWEMNFGQKTGVDWTAATSYLFDVSATVGTFDPTKIRGRGAWFDDGKSVLHLGNRLLVDGVEHDIPSFKTQFIYEKKPPLEGLMPEGYLDESGALRLHQITGMLNWQKPVNSVILAGWIVLAPICGAMTWRPHVWVTGQRGTGKSWMVDNIVAPAIGASALTVQSNSTEAGIRQRLKQDARPVIFDEAEGESQHARQRMQSVLELARQASSDGLAEIAKGTAGGKALSFKIRSMFFMGSINVGLAQASDKSRFTILTLTKAPHGVEGRKQFEELEATVNNTLTKEFCAGLRARTYHLIPVIRENAKVFAKAAAEHIGNQRAGDQLGALLAGAWSLGSSDVVSAQDAKEYVEGQDWGLDVDDAIDSDEMTLMNEILSAKVEIEVEGGMRRNRTVAEIIDKTTGESRDFEYTEENGENALARIGIRCKEDAVIVSESHPKLRSILKETPWGGGWADVLGRIPGAARMTAYRFAGMRTRAVKIPKGEIMR